MTIKYISINMILFFLSCACASLQPLEQSPNYADYVSTLVGSESEHALSNGNTYPAIALPWGMHFWTPQTGKMGDGWTYTYTGREIRGFKQTHQPSPWINDYGQFSLMPVTNDKGVDEVNRASCFSHKTEIARPYYYRVYLADHNVTTEITPTERAAMMRFTFPDSDKSAVIIDAFDQGSYLKVLSDQQTVIGYSTRNNGGVPDNFKNWFVVCFDTPFISFEIYEAGKDTINGEEFIGDHGIVRINFKTKHNEQIQARIASSFISLKQAYTNLNELEDNNFDRQKYQACLRWNEILGKIDVSGGTDSQLRTFYSCLYRSTLFPRKFYEITEDGDVVHYSPFNGEIRKGYMYTDTGFWDTFRALFPLLNLVYPSVNAEIQQGLANTVQEGTFLPEWASPGHRDCMIGNNSASVVMDAVVKGVNDKNLLKLYQAMVYGTDHRHPTIKSTGRWGYEFYNSLGYIPYDVDIHENVARTLEYAYNDWCILQMAKYLKRPQNEITRWSERCQNYRNVFDSTVLLMRGRNQDGSFQTPFSPYKWGDAFTEGNSWHYTFSVFHDIQGLINLMGGKKQFITMLDSVFVVPPIYDDSYYGFRIHEITEMIVANMGNYAHGNQPAQHMIYLYNYAGEPWKTQFWVREIMNRLYMPYPDGYCGDEDNGQTSAWYVFSAMGFYPVCPGSDQYILGSPLFKHVTINLENDNKIKLVASDNSDENRYINSITYNKDKYFKNYFNHSDLINGAKIVFDMCSQPNKQRGVTSSSFPYSFSNK